MNKSHSNKMNQKRRSKNHPNLQKWKKTKLEPPRVFQGANFDSSSNDNQLTLTNKVSAPLPSQYFKQSISLSPSKSEFDNSRFESPSFEVCDTENNTSCPLVEDRFGDKDTSFTYNSILEELMDDDSDNCGEVVSVPLQGVENSEKKRRNKTDNLQFNGTSKSPKNNSKSLDQNSDSVGSFSSNLLGKDAQYYNVNDGILILIEKNDTVYFYGMCLLTVLHGQIEILGHILTKNSPQAQLYSPRGSSLLYLKNITESDVPVTSYLLNFKLSNQIKPTEKCAVVFCTKLQSDSLKFVEKHISQQILPIEASNFPRVVFQPKEGNWNVLKVNEEWNDLVDKVDDRTKLMICGGKGVGKTTFLRYAINRLLMRFGVVQVIDLDPGQSEFTIPGCISIVKVCKPVFGVSYTHLQEVERSILSNINIGYEPDKYIASVKELMKTNLEQIPTLINYMGYTHGIGFNILSAVITCIKPSDIVQICSRNSKKNYKFILERDIVAENAQLFTSVPTDLSYNLSKIDSMSDENDSWTAEPRQLREMSVLSYISNLVECNSIFKSKAPLYKISLNDVQICSLNGEEISPAAINGCLVSLCTLVNKNKYIFQCFSWGIVRGIDLVANELVLLTSEKLEVLDRITHLVSNGVTLPPSVYMTSDDMPTVMEKLVRRTQSSNSDVSTRPQGKEGFSI